MYFLLANEMNMLWNRIYVGVREQVKYVWRKQSLRKSGY